MIRTPISSGSCSQPARTDVISLLNGTASPKLRESPGLRLPKSLYGPGKAEVRKVGRARTRSGRSLLTVPFRILALAGARPQLRSYWSEYRHANRADQGKRDVI